MRRLSHFLSLITVIQLIVPIQILTWGANIAAASEALPSHSSGQGASRSSTTPVNLDLSSTDRTQFVSPRQVFQSATIIEGGVARTITPSAAVTPAEQVAVMQVLRTGQQSLELGQLGDAVGGSLNLGWLNGRQVSSLVLPRGVSALQNFARAGTLNVIGNLNNSGSLVAVSSNPAVGTAVINAGNIVNNQHAVISSVAPAQSSGLLASLNLNLNSVHDIINAGIIKSSGNLNLTAGGSIVNALPAGATGPQPVMQAANSINLLAGSGNVVNSGLISAAAGDININSQTARNFVVNNLGGRLEAITGLINIRDGHFSDKLNLSLNGGDFVSKELNLFSGNGTVNVNVSELDSRLNITAGEAHVITSTDRLVLGDMNLSGDPTYYNTTGSVVIGGALSFTGQHLAIVANTDITTTTGAGAINTGSSGASAGSITMVAGAAFTSTGPSSASNDTTSILTITGSSLTGGKIDLTSTVSITSLNSRSTFSTGSGGNINLVAFAGSNSGSGTIKLPTAVTITSGGGSSGASNGSVSITAGAALGTTASITTGPINTSGVTNGTGNITINTATPTLPSGSVTIQNGNVTGGTFGAGTSQTSTLSVGALTGSGSTITVNAGLNALVGGAISNSGSGTQTGGTVTISTNSTTVFNIAAGATTNGVAGTITANGAGSTGAGGTISITNSGNGGITLGAIGNVSATSAGGNGGNLTLDAGQGTLSIPNGTITLSGAGSGAAKGGTFTFNASTLSVTGGALTLTANGSGTGAGGTVSVTVTSATSDLTVGGSTGNIRVNARNGGSGGDGGILTLSAGRNIVVAPGSLNINPGSGSGKGAILTFSAGNSAPGNLRITGNLNADGRSTGGGGSITLICNSSSSFILGDDATNGTNTLSATGGNSSGNGGSFTVVNNGTGGITLENIDKFDASATIGSGGTLLMDAGSGTITIPPGTLAFDGNGNGTGDENGGSITLIASNLATTSSGGLVLDVDASQTSGATGKGGTVSVTTTSAAFTLTVGTGNAELQISARSGVAGGDGGTVTLSSGTTLRIEDTGLITAGPQVSGKGPTYNLTGGTAGVGPLKITGSISANGVGSGDGGEIYLSAYSRAALHIGNTASANFISGSLSANSGSGGGSGGIISATMLGPGGIELISTSNVSATAVAGNGGQLTFDSGIGVITLPSGTLSFNGAGSGARNGGQITLYGSIITGSGSLSLNATGSQTGGATGSGGTISITATGATSDITVGSGTLNLALTNKGGIAGGNGGIVTLAAGRNIVLAPASLLASTTAGNGDGAQVTLAAGTAGSGTLQVTAAISAAGIGNGKGGSLILSCNSTSPFILGSSATNGIAGVASNSTGSSGDGGTISVTNGSTGGITLQASGNIVSTVSNGKGGSLTLDAGLGVLSLPSGNLTISGAGAGAHDGGEIILNAASITMGGALTLNANGSQAAATGKGGTISITVSGQSSDIAVGSGNLVLNATGGAQGGDGGTLILSAGRNVTVNPGSVSFAPLSGNSKGASITLTAGTNLSGNVSVTGALSAAGNGTGDGGSITLTSNSTSTFDLGDGSVNGVSGVVNVDSGSSGGKGGSITVTNNGNGGITLASIGNVSSSVTSGGGGALTFSAGSGALSLPTGTLFFRGVGTGARDGGSITMSGASLSVSGGGTITLNADASQTATATGAGGTVSVSVTGVSSDLTIGSGSSTGNLVVSAKGGVAGGNGGSLTASAGRNLTVDPSSVSLAPQSGNGNGGIVSFQAGSAGSGNLFVNGAFSQNGLGTGSGGSITLRTNSASVFSIDSLASGNGVKGALSVNSGSSGGAGGSISVINSGSGGITLGAIGNLSATALGGVGGSFTLDAAAGASDGPLTLPIGSLTVNAAGGDFRGGSISLSGSTISIATGALTLNANATGTGNGGTITVTSTATTASGDITVGGVSGGYLVINAQGGSASALGGDGGTVTIAAGRNLTVNPASLSARPQGTNGGGPVISLSGGSTTTTGTVVVSGAINANGTGIGQGGSVTLLSNSATTFNIGTAGSNGVGGTVTANAGVTSGAGGTIVVRNYGSGGVQLGAIGNLSVTAASGAGGTLILDGAAGTTDGVLTIPTGTLTVAAGAGGFDGGNLTLAGSGLSVSGGALTLTADASGTGRGGTVNVTTTANSATGDLNIGTGIIINARGGNTSTAGGDGGTVVVSAGRNLNVTVASLNAGPRGVNGDGASITLSGGGSAGAGTLVINAALSVSGVGIGDGGVLSLRSNSSTAFNIGTAGTNGVGGALTANAGTTSGAGGSVSVYNYGTGGITLGAIGNVSVTTTASNGGSLTLDASAGATGGTLTIPTGTLTVAAGAGGHDGGQITLRGSRITGTVTLNANATGGGNGGMLSVTTTGNTSLADLTVGSGGFTLSALGGSTNSATGNGGTVSVSAGRNLAVTPGSVTAGPQGVNGSGEHLSFSAGGQSSAGALTITAGLNVDSTGGNGTGAGGSIVLVSNSSTVFNIGTAGTNGITGTLSAQAAGINGQGGSISVTNYGTGGVTLGAIGNVNVSSSFGSGGSITLDAAAGATGGTLTIPAGTLAADADPGVLSGLAVLTFGGGQITLRGLNLSFTGLLTLSAQPVGQGDGGTVNITTTSTTSSGDLTFGGASGNRIVVNANGGTSGSAEGDGGTVVINSGRLLTINSGGLNLGQLGANGNGPNITLAGGNATTAGTLVVNTALSASGLVLGNGGIINLSSNSSTLFNIGTAGTNGVSGTITSVAGSATFAGGAITITNYGTGGIQVGANVTGGPIITTAIAPTTVNASVTVQSDSNIIMNGNGSSITNQGLVTSTKNAASITLQSTSALTVGGTGNVSISGGGAAQIVVQATGANALAFTGNQTFDPGSAGNVSFKSTVTNASITVAANATQTISSGAPLTISTPALSFLGAGATITATGASAIGLDSGGGSNDLTITAQDGANTATISTTGGTITIVPTTGRTLTFAKSAGAGTTTLNLNGGEVTTITTVGTTVNQSVTVATDNMMTFNVNASTFTNNGNVMSSASAGIATTGVLLTVQSTGALTVAGTGTYTLTGSTASGVVPQVQFTASGDNLLQITGSNTYSLGSGGVNIFAQGASASLTFAGSTTQTMTSGLYIYLSSPNVTFGNGTILDQSQATDSTILVDSGDDSVALSVVLPASGSATLISGSYGTTIYPYGSNQNLSITSPGTATLNVNGGPVYLMTFTGNQTIGAGATLQSNNSIEFDFQGNGTLSVNGSIRATTAASQITVNGWGSTVNLAGSPGTIGGGATSIVIEADNLNFNSSYNFNASGGTVNILTPTDNTGAIAIPTGVTLTSGGGSYLRVVTTSLTLGSGSTIAGTATTGTAIDLSYIVAGNAGLMTINLPGGSATTANLQSSGGLVNIQATSSLSFANPNGGTTTLNVTGGSLFTQSDAGTYSIATGVTLKGSSNITLSMNGTSQLIDDGAIQSTGAGSSIRILGGGGTTSGTFTMGGTPQTISVAGAGSILVQGFNALGINSSYGFSTGSGGSVTFASPTSITLAAGAIQSLTGGGTVSVNTPQVTFGNGSRISTDKTSGTGMTFGLGYTSMTVNVPGSGTGTLLTSGAAISIAAGTGLSIQRTAATTGTANFQVNGGPVTTSVGSGTITISANVNLSSTGTLTLGSPFANIVNDGTIGGTAASGATATTISAQSLTNTGTITGSSGANIVLNTGAGTDLTVTGAGSITAVGTGTVSISATLGSVSVTQSQITGTVSGSALRTYSLTTTSGNNLTVGSISAGFGDLSITAGSPGSNTVLTVAGGSTVNANEGTITIMNSDTAGGTIVIGAPSTSTLINAFTASTNTALGNVRIVVGPVPASPANQDPTGRPANVSVNIVGAGAAIYWGQSSITVQNPSVVNAFERTVIFNSAISSSSITLRGAVTVVADPPVPGAVIIFATLEEPIPPTISLPQISTMPVFATASSVTQVDMLSGSALRWFDTGNSVVKTDMLFKEQTAYEDNSISDAETLDDDNLIGGPNPEEKKDQEQDLKPIAFMAPDGVPGNARMMMLHTLEIDAGIVKHAGSARMAHDGKGVVTLRGGETLIAANKTMTVKCAQFTVLVKKGACALISREGKVLKVRNLFEAAANSVRLQDRDKYVELAAGQEVMLSSSAQALENAASRDGFGRRRIHTTELSQGVKLARCEVSLVSVMRKNGTVSTMMRSDDEADRKMANKVIKMAACLMYATGTHGAYAATR